MDILAEVVFSDDFEQHSTTMQLSLTKIDKDGNRSEKTPIWNAGDVKEFLTSRLG